MLGQSELNEVILLLIKAINASSVVNDYRTFETPDVQKAKQAFETYINHVTALYRKISCDKLPETYTNVYNETMLSQPQTTSAEYGFFDKRTMLYFIPIGKIVKQLNTDFSNHMVYTGPHLGWDGTPLHSTIGSDESRFVYSARFTCSNNPVTNSPNYHFIAEIMSSRTTQMIGTVLFFAGLALIQSYTLGIGMAATGAGILACGFFTTYCPATRQNVGLNRDYIFNISGLDNHGNPP